MALYRFPYRNQFDEKVIGFCLVWSLWVSIQGIKAAAYWGPYTLSFDDSLPIEVWVDASDFAIGATLV